MTLRLLALAVLAASASAGAADNIPPATEAEAIAHLMAVNDHEIQTAELAASKGVSAAVADYAAMLKKEHSENQTKAQALPSAPGTGEDVSADLTAQKEKAAAERDALAAKSGDDFEAAYLDAMVTGHAEALTLIDTQLLPAAKTDAVKSHFTTTREHVAMHLEKAKELQAK